MSNNDPKNLYELLKDKAPSQGTTLTADEFAENVLDDLIVNMKNPGGLNLTQNYIYSGNGNISFSPQELRDYLVPFVEFAFTGEQNAFEITNNVLKKNTNYDEFKFKGSMQAAFELQKEGVVFDFEQFIKDAQVIKDELNKAIPSVSPKKIDYDNKLKDIEQQIRQKSNNFMNQMNNRFSELKEYVYKIVAMKRIYYSFENKIVAIYNDLVDAVSNYKI